MDHASGRTVDAAERHAREAVVLPHLATKLPVAVPLPFEALAPCPAAPFGAFAYRELPGRVMSVADATGGAAPGITGQLGRALAALHAISSAMDSLLPIPDADPNRFAGLYATTVLPLKARLISHAYSRVDSWWLEFLNAHSTSSTVRTLVHGDPWRENLTVDDSRLTGILDWEFLSWSDPANDIGITLQKGEPFFQAVLNSYLELRATDRSALERRARQLFAAGMFYGVKFAIDRNDESEWDDSLAKLRAGPILNP